MELNHDGVSSCCHSSRLRSKSACLRIPGRHVNFGVTKQSCGHRTCSECHTLPFAVSHDNPFDAKRSARKKVPPVSRLHCSGLSGNG